MAARRPAMAGGRWVHRLSKPALSSPSLGARGSASSQVEPASHPTPFDVLRVRRSASAQDIKVQQYGRHARLVLTGSVFGGS